MAGCIVNPVIYLRKASDDSLDTSGTIDSYTSGASSVRQKLYKSDGLEHPFSNPMAGQYELGPIAAYGNTAITYRLVLIDSDGTTLSTTDSIIGIRDPRKLTSTLDIGSYAIVSPAGQDVILAPSGGANLNLNGVYWPRVAPETGTILTATSATNTVWAGSPGLEVSQDSSPQLYANLDSNGFHINFRDGDDIIDSNGNKQISFTRTALAVNYITIVNAATDNNPSITVSGDDTNIDLKVAATGYVKISGLYYPNQPGPEGYFLRTDGAGYLTFSGVAVFQQRATTSIDVNNSVTSEWTNTAITPDIAHGDEIASITFTPRQSNSKLRITAHVHLIWSGTNSNGIIALFNTASSDALSASIGRPDGNTKVGLLELEHIEDSGSTSARTYSIRAGADNLSVNPHFNSTDASSADFGGKMRTYFEIEEFMPI